MPLLFVLVHLVAAVLGFCAVWLLRKRSAVSGVIGILALLLVAAGFCVERREDWAWRLMPLFGANFVFLTNLSLAGVTVLFGLMWVAASDKRERRRAIWFGLPLFAVAIWSYVWYFEPLPQGIDGQVDAKGFCRQSAQESCSAASAVMLFHHNGVRVTEREMAELCLTRAGKGTPPAGLYRGIATKAAMYGLRPQVLRLSQPEELRSLRGTAIINVGLKADTPSNIAAKMQEYGWNVGAWHTVVVTGTDATGQWIHVADPTNGLERWPADELRHLWSGDTLILIKP
jgi:hypothetical protein